MGMVSIAQSTEATFDLTINLKGLKSEIGPVNIGLYDVKSQWLKTPLKGGSTKIVDGVAVIVFSDLLPGDYAISTYHDENDNGELDSNLVGIPKEPYAFSNNARNMFGPASWDDSQFSLKDHKTIVINF